MAFCLVALSSCGPDNTDYVEKVVGVVNECLVTHLLAVVVDEYVAHYGIYPPFEIGVWSVFVHVAQCFQ